MFRLYDKGYKIGFVLTLCIFAVVNVVEYIKASDEYSGSKFRMISGARGFPAWGFPFDWNLNYFGWVEDGPILNFIAIVVCGFVVGVIFRYFRLKYLDFRHK